MKTKSFKKLRFICLLTIIIGITIFQNWKWVSLRYSYYFKWSTKDREIWNDLEKRKINQPSQAKLLENFKKGTNLFFSNDEENTLLGIEILKKLADTKQDIHDEMGIIPKANNILGQFYMHGKGSIKKNTDKAIRYLNKAIHKENFESSFYKIQNQKDIEYLKKEEEFNIQNINANLACCFYEKGDNKKAISYAQEAASRGFSWSWIFLAEHCVLRKDFNFAKICIDEAIKAKDYEVISYIISMLVTGKMIKVEGVPKGELTYPKDIKKAITLIDEIEKPELFELAGDLFTRHELGWIVDGNKGVEYYKKAAELGSVYSLYQLARLYFLGLCGIAKNIEKGKDYLMQAADHDEPNACYFLGQSLLEGISDFTRNINKATYYLHKSCEMNNVDALFYLGISYLTGRHGLPKNKEVALELLDKADKLGHLPSSCAIGKYWLNEKVYKKAILYLEKATAANDPESQFCLAELYRFGLGVEKNLEKALNLYELSAAQGYEKAILLLNQLKASD